MGTARQGQQIIGWKFSTPLQADYLNTFISGFSSQGLITRPMIIPQSTSYGADIVIKPFSLLITPEDTISNTLIDENNEIIHQKMVKVTTTSDIKLTINEEIVALGFQYSFSDPQGTTQSQWYGEVIALDSGDITTFKGVIIATCQNYKDSGNLYFSVKSSGADISDFLLMKEGWNPNKWLSVISPRRVVDGNYYNKLEVRCHNDAFKGYINGNSGLCENKNLTYTLNTDVDENLNPDGIRGFMPDNYNAFKLQSDGFSIAETNSVLPIEKTSGGIFALVDASLVNQKNFSTSFTNNLIIKPVISEDVNVYFDNGTLFIR